MAFLEFQPFTPPTIKTNPFKIITKQVYAGENLKYELDYCIYAKVPTENNRKIVGLTSPYRVYFLASTFIAGLEPGCKKIIVQFPIGADVVAGKYKVVTEGRYHVNIKKVEVKEFESETFEVLSATKSAK